jgi:chromate transport protein ChrA
LHAISFRRPQDYVLLLLAMAACFSLGRRRSRDMFQIILMIACLALAFTRQRDIWVLALASVAVIADGFRWAQLWRSRRTTVGHGSRRSWQPLDLC